MVPLADTGINVRHFATILILVVLSASPYLAKANNDPLINNSSEKEKVVEVINDPRKDPKKEEIIVEPSGAPSGVLNGDLYISEQQDSSVNSLCKFNFIFYFLYKFKYEDDSPSESLFP